MRAPSNLMLALLSLSISSAFAAGPESVPVDAGGLRDSSGQPVLDGFGECWGTSFTRPDAAACAVMRERQAASSAAAASASATGRSASSASPEPGSTGGGAAGAAASNETPAQQTINARGNPAYLTDSNGNVVRASQGECWRTGSWTPALATVVGCDGVLAKAAPVPAPAPSPKPQPVPPAQAAPQSEAGPPLVAPEAEAAPPLVAPSETPPAAAAPAPEARTAPPVVAPPSPAPGPAELAPEGERGAATAAATQPKSEKITLDTDAYFDFDKATLKPDGERKLKEIADRLSAMNLEVVVATGHTDWTGTDAYNQKLSERRAAAVKRFLTQQGLPAGRIFTEGKGEKEPVATNHTREGRAQNRRVVVETVGTRNR